MINQKIQIKNLALALMAASSAALAEDMQFRGFFQAAAGYNDLNGKRYLGWSEDKVVFDHNVFALQATGEISENASATWPFVLMCND